MKAKLCKTGTESEAAISLTHVSEAPNNGKSGNQIVK